MLTVALDFPFSLLPSVISNVYLTHFENFECILELFRQCEVSCLFFILSDINQLNKEGLISAYHDRSDGGVITTLLEMAFATHCGLDIFESEINTLFNEELGCVIQVENNNKAAVENALAQAGLIDCTRTIAHCQY
jgi:phosphoribosylformylglycinamidine (FGAM) synthase-like enzyme